MKDVLEEHFRKEQEDYAKLSQLFANAATKILAYSTISYLVSENGLKVIYPKTTLRALACIRSQARVTFKVRFGFDPFKKHRI